MHSFQIHTFSPLSHYLILTDFQTPDLQFLPSIKGNSIQTYSLSLAFTVYVYVPLQVYEAWCCVRLGALMSSNIFHHSRVGKNREGQVTIGVARAGQGRARDDRAGQGRAGQVS